MNLRLSRSQTRSMSSFDPIINGYKEKKTDSFTPKKRLAALKSMSVAHFKIMSIRSFFSSFISENSRFTHDRYTYYFSREITIHPLVPIKSNDLIVCPLESKKKKKEPTTTLQPSLIIHYHRIFFKRGKLSLRKRPSAFRTARTQFS